MKSYLFLLPLLILAKKDAKKTDKAKAQEKEDKADKGVEDSSEATEPAVTVDADQEVYEETVQATIQHTIRKTLKKVKGHAKTAMPTAVAGATVLAAPTTVATAAATLLQTASAVVTAVATPIATSAPKGLQIFKEPECNNNISPCLLASCSETVPCCVGYSCKNRGGQGGKCEPENCGPFGERCWGKDEGGNEWKKPCCPGIECVEKAPFHSRCLWTNITCSLAQ